MRMKNLEFHVCFKKLKRIVVLLFYRPRSKSSVSMESSHSKRPFTLDEDRVLLQFVALNGPRSWGQLAAQLHNRTPKQCRERWNNQLNPGINRSPWSPEEDEILAEKHAALGNQWAKIARFLPGRNDTQVKNRWNTCGKARTRDFKDPLAAHMSNSLQSWLDWFADGKGMPFPFIDMESLPPLNRGK
jgi:hypothetical protein